MTIQKVRTHRSWCLFLLLQALGSIPAASQPFAYVANSGSNSVSVIDTTTNAVVGPPIIVGLKPVGVAITPDGTRAYVTNNGIPSSVSVIDIATGRVTPITHLSFNQPNGVAMTPDGRRAYIANNGIGSTKVSVIDTDPNSPTLNTVTHEVIVGRQPFGMAITPDGTLAYVTNGISGDVSVIDIATNGSTLISDCRFRFPEGIAITPNGTRAYVANPGSPTPYVIVIDTDRNSPTFNTVLQAISVGELPTALAISPDGTRVYVTHASVSFRSVSVIDTATNSVVAGIMFPAGLLLVFPQGIAITPDGTRAYVTRGGSSASSVSVIDTDPSSNTYHTIIGDPIGVESFPVGIAITPRRGPSDHVDLSITKTHSGNFAVGTNGVYTLGITNVGTAPTTGTITVSDTLPAGLSYVSATGTDWSCAASGQAVTCIRTVALTAIQSSSITVTVAVGAAAAPSVTNTAMVSTPGDTNARNDTASDPTTITSATLTVTKVLVPSGDSGTFNLQINGVIKKNGAGNGDSTGAQVVSTGSNTVGETEGTGTTQANYTSTLACVITATSTAVPVSSNTGTGGSVSLSNGDNVTCTFTNTRKTLTLRVQKALSPANDLGTFDLSIGATVVKSGAANGDFGTAIVNVGDSVTVSEAAHSGTTLGNYTSTLACDSGVTPSFNTGISGIVTVSPAANTSITCTFTNVRKATAQVIKTIGGGLLSAADSFTFQLRQGASTTAAGTILASGVTNLADVGTITFANTLDLNQTYQLCEVVMPGWKSSLPSFWLVYNPTGDNSTICTNVGAGTALPLSPGLNTFRIDNTRPPGGLSQTIGFWKNWTSCTGGGQAALLDANLPVIVDDYFTITTCQVGFGILNKSDISSGKKMASDPLYNLAAQYVAAVLNYHAGAFRCPASDGPVNQAQALLNKYHFTGTGSYTTDPNKLSTADATLANTLAAQLDAYNNNFGVCSP